MAKAVPAVELAYKGEELVYVNEAVHVFEVNVPEPKEDEHIWLRVRVGGKDIDTIWIGPDYLHWGTP